MKLNWYWIYGKCFHGDIHLQSYESEYMDKLKEFLRGKQRDRNIKCVLLLDPTVPLKKKSSRIMELIIWLEELDSYHSIETPDGLSEITCT